MVGQGRPREATAGGQADVPQAAGEATPAHDAGEKRTEGERGPSSGGHAQVPGHQLYAAGDQGGHSHIAANVDQDHIGNVRVYHRRDRRLHQGD